MNRYRVIADVKHRNGTRDPHATWYGNAPTKTSAKAQAFDDLADSGWTVLNLSVEYLREASS